MTPNGEMYKAEFEKRFQNFLKLILKNLLLNSGTRDWHSKRAVAAFPLFVPARQWNRAFETVVAPSESAKYSYRYILLH